MAIGRGTQEQLDILAEDKNQDDTFLLSVEEILSGSAHALTIFTADEIADLRIFEKRGKPYLTCYATGKDPAAKKNDPAMRPRPAPLP